MIIIIIIGPLCSMLIRCQKFWNPNSQCLAVPRNLYFPLLLCRRDRICSPCGGVKLLLHFPANPESSVTSTKSSCDILYCLCMVLKYYSETTSVNIYIYWFSIKLFKTIWWFINAKQHLWIYWFQSDISYWESMHVDACADGTLTS